MTTRMEVQRTIPADPAAIFRVLSDPHGHVAIDSSGMLQDATGTPAQADGDTFVISYYDWSDIDPVWKEADIFPIMSEGALRATLGILDRTVTKGTRG